MKPLLFLTSALLVAAPVSADDPPKEDKAAKAKVSVYDEKADAKAQIASAVAASKRENRRVLIQWGGNWCGWCLLLDAKFKSDKELAKLLRYEYDVVHVDSKNKDLFPTYGLDGAKLSYPHLTILDGDGKVLVNQNTEPFETKADGKNGHDPKKLHEFLTKHQAVPKKADDVLAAALAEAAKSDRKVLLHFGAPWCGWCHRLDVWLLKPEVAAVMGKDYIDLKIDQDRMTGGKDLLERFNAGQKGGIPWFVILDPAGKAVVTSDGPKGNIGFPADPHEIEHFVTMLNKSRKRLSEKDVDGLKESLAKPTKK